MDDGVVEAEAEVWLVQVVQEGENVGEVFVMRRGSEFRKDGVLGWERKRGGFDEKSVGLFEVSYGYWFA